MANPSKRKGTTGETAVSKYLNAHGLFAERKALAGSDDKGDLRIILADGTEVTVEVKAGKQTANFPRGRLNYWKEQTLKESENSGCKAVLVVVRYMRRLVDAEVWMPNRQWGGISDGWTMMYLNDFVKEMGGS